MEAGGVALVGGQLLIAYTTQAAASARADLAGRLTMMVVFSGAHGHVATLELTDEHGALVATGSSTRYAGLSYHGKATFAQVPLSAFVGPYGLGSWASAPGTRWHLYLRWTDGSTDLPAQARLGKIPSEFATG